MTSKTNDVQPFPNASTPTATLTAGLVITTPTLTKLELISAMCLQGLVANSERAGYAEKQESALAIRCAKELIKQLGEDNEN